MLTFKQFLKEDKPPRDPNMAIKILNRIKQKRMVNNKEMLSLGPPLPEKERLKAKTHKGWPIDFDTFKEEGEVRDVPLHTIRTTQETVLPDIIDQKLRGKRDSDTEHALFIKNPDGTHTLYDGNHRYHEARLMRQTHMKGIVVDRDPDYVFYDDEK
jgi:hypothetical protein